jgi:hypothetical protein
MAKSKSHMHVSIDADSARAGTKLITPSVVSRGDELIENESQTKQTHLIKFLLAYFCNTWSQFYRVLFIIINICDIISKKKVECPSLIGSSAWTCMYVSTCNPVRSQVGVCVS